jgi:plasmid replication initiation protein
MSDQQIDFVLDSILDAPVKGERALMEFPFFALTKRPRTLPIVYDDGMVRVEIQPGHKGIATIWDKDVLIYGASIVNGRLERGLEVQPRLRFAAHEFLRTTGRSTSARGYELFLDALDRLQSTAVRTTITSGHEDIQERRAFSWIDKYRVVTRRTARGRQVMAAVEITLNEWLWRALVENRRVLTISPDYFALERGLERRLYELARKHCGRQHHWRIGLPRLAEKCGSSRGLKQLKAELARIIARDRLPEYRFELEPPAPGAGLPELMVRFAPRADVALPPDPGEEPPPASAAALALQPRTIERARRETTRATTSTPWCTPGRAGRGRTTPRPGMPTGRSSPSAATTPAGPQAPDGRRGADPARGRARPRFVTSRTRPVDGLVTSRTSIRHITDLQCRQILVPLRKFAAIRGCNYI